MSPETFATDYAKRVMGDGPSSLRCGPCPLKRRYDSISSGIDEQLQGLSGDGVRGFYRQGIRIPKLATADTTPGVQNGRYLFLLAVQKLSVFECRRIVSVGVQWTIGVRQGTGEGGNTPPFRVIEFPVTTSGWVGPDYNVSFSLRVIPRDEVKRLHVGPFDVQSFMQKFSDFSCLLYQDADFDAGNLNPINGRPDYYTKLIDYVPPKLGRPWGLPIVPELQTFYNSALTPLDCPHDNVDVLVNGGSGGASIALFATVLQGAGSPTATFPAADAVYTGGYPNEEAFLQNFPGAVPWRVTGRLISEDA